MKTRDDYLMPNGYYDTTQIREDAGMDAPRALFDDIFSVRRP